jgi:hypothetical protein
MEASVFQAFIEAAVRRAKEQQSLLWADRVATRIAASTPLSVGVADIAERVTEEAARLGVPVTIEPRANEPTTGETAPAAA